MFPGLLQKEYAVTVQKVAGVYTVMGQFLNDTVFCTIISEMNEEGSPIFNKTGETFCKQTKILPKNRMHLMKIHAEL